jgi:hypothetical protein
MMRKILVVSLAAGTLALTACGGAADTANTTDTLPSTSAPATLALDGTTVPLVHECAGVDGAVLVTTQGEVTVTLVREDGLALRYSGEGATAETGDVTTTDNADGSTTYTGTISGSDTGTVAIELTLTAAAADLPAC